VPVVGIPRGLLYYHYLPLWRDFFTGLGIEVMESGPTTRAIVKQGLAVAVDEICLPVKVFFGHVEELKDKVDYLFIPRLVSVEKRAFICPKLLGLPDMIRYSVVDLPPLLEPTVNLSKSRRGLYRVVDQMAIALKVHPVQAWLSFLKAWQHWRTWQHLQQQGLVPLDALAALDNEVGAKRDGNENKLCVGVLGHPYNIYDDYINLGTLQRLAELGVEVRTPEMLSPVIIKTWAKRLPKESFWTLGKNILGAAGHFLHSGEFDGIIHLISFGCGPDSLVGELVERHAHRGGGFPFLLLTLDEHTGEAGLATRIEAFVDTLEWRKKG
jgi:predicted nucleotide-binding protein (sugar kinase/HSP70/actin superfamily)